MGCLAEQQTPFAVKRAFAMILACTTALAIGSTARSQAAPAKEGKGTAALKTGLHLHLPKAFRGYTLFAPLNSTRVFLIDMEGKVAHSWEGAARPASCAYLLENGHLLRPCLYEEKTTPFGTGGGAGGRVQEFTWEGELVWDFQMATDKKLSHHDVRKLPSGNVLLIIWEMKEPEEVARAGRKMAVNLRADAVIEVRPTGKTTGEIVWEWHAWDHLVQDADESKANYGDVGLHPELIDVNFGPGSGKGGKGGGQPGKGGVDWTHTNAVDYSAELDQIMLSVPTFGEVWIIDHSTSTAGARGHSGGKSGKGGDLLYRWGNPQVYRAGSAANQQLFGQHHAQWIGTGLPGAGHLLVFNNGNGRPGGTFSSVDEAVLPVDGKGSYNLRPGMAYGPEKPLWTYLAANKTDFYSFYISGAQRLKNGNTLICSGADGIFFEVTPEKEVVWKYVNPVRRAGESGPTDPKGGPAAKAKAGGAPTPGAVFRAFRYAPDYAGLAGRDLSATKTIEELLSTEGQKKGD